MSKKMPPGPLSAMSDARQSVDIRIPASSELNNLVRLGKWFAGTIVTAVIIFISKFFLVFDTKSCKKVCGAIYKPPTSIDYTIKLHISFRPESIGRHPWEGR